MLDYWILTYPITKTWWISVPHRAGYPESIECKPKNRLPGNVC